MTAVDKLIHRVVHLERSLKNMRTEFAWDGPLFGMTAEDVHDLLIQRIEEALEGELVGSSTD
jgi:hypothetical protein